jgi:hypothetical protein
MLPPNTPVPPDVANALRRGNLIEALKLLRKAQGLGLAEAKALLDAHLRAEAASQKKAGTTTRRAAYPTAMSRDSHLSPGEVPRTAGSGFWVVVVMIAAALAAWYWVR